MKCRASILLDSNAAAVEIYFCLTNVLVSNYEYYNLTNSIEHYNDIMTVATVLWVALHTGAAHLVVCLQSLQIHDPQNSINLEYEQIFSKVFSPGTLGH